MASSPQSSRGSSSAVEGRPEWSEGERSEPERNGGRPSTAGAPAPSSPREIPDPEVQAKACRRRFTAEYKLRIVGEADASTEHGHIGALLRREGLYGSHLVAWRKQRDQGALQAMASRKRGPKAKRDTAETKRIEELQREIRRLQRKLSKAEAIIDFQKKVHELLGIPMRSPDDEGSD